MILKCEICQQPLASFDPEKIKLPLHRDMFVPISGEVGLPSTWESPNLFDWQCFYGHTPFLVEFNTVEEADANIFPKRLYTDEGYWYIGSKPPAILKNIEVKHGYYCKHCGKEYQHAGYWRRHEEKCQLTSKK